MTSETANVNDGLDKNSRKKKNVFGSRVRVKSRHCQEIKDVLEDANAPKSVQWLQECLESADSFQQVNLIRKIGYFLQKSQATNADHVKLSIRVLIEFYLQADSRHITKRAVASTLQAIPTMHLDMIVSSFREAISENILVAIKHSQNEEIQRCLAENIISCLENFNLGAKCIAGISASVLNFLHLALEFFRNQFENASCPTSAAKASLDCQTTIRSLIAVLQKSPPALRERTNLVESDLLAILKRHVDSTAQVLTNDSYSLDCRCSCGIALPLLLAVSKDQNYTLEKLVYFVLDNDDRGCHCVLLSSTSRKLLGTLLSPVSKLCLFVGLLSVVGTNELVSKIEDEKTLLFQIILPHILSSAKCERESAVAVVTSRAIFMWTKRAKEAIQEKPDDVLLRSKLKGDGDIACCLLEYVWTQWEHFIDCIRHTTRDIFDNVVTLHILSSNEVTNESPFVLWLTGTLLKMPWDRRGKYGVLCCLVKHVGAKKMLELKPSIPNDLISSMKDPSVVSHALELMEALFVSHKSEMHDDSDEWDQLWVLPIIMLFSEMEVEFQVEHILTKLLKCSPLSLTFIVSELVTLQSESSGKASHLRALLLTAKTSRQLGLVKQNPSKGGFENFHLSWNELFSSDLLKLALCHVDDKIRLDAFGLLCESPKTTEILPAADLEMICVFLPYNMTNQSPAFRQKLLALFKKLLFRINDGGQTVRRQLEQIHKHDPDSAEVLPLWKTIKLYQGFLTWLSANLFESLYPGANFPRRGMALNILKLIRDIVGFKTEKILDVQFHIKPSLEPYQIQTLLECLKDTYDTNKAVALNMLMSLSTEQLGFDNLARTSDLFEAALQLASGAKPTDCVTAAYLFRLMARHSPTATIAKSTLKALEDVGISHDFQRPNLTLFSSASDAEEPFEMRDCDVAFVTLNVLTFQLMVQLEMARGSLLDAADHAPMYGVLFSIRSLVQDLNFSDLVDNKWRTYFATLIGTCLDIGKTVSPIVNNASPEGHLPIATEPDEGAELHVRFQRILSAADGSGGGGEVVLDDTSVRTWAITAQKLVLCGWRTMKELSLLLGDICQRSIEVMHKQTMYSEGTAASEDIKDTFESRLVEVDDILRIGDYFITLLAETKHRGAFEQAYVGFCKVCDGLWRNSIGALHQLPARWLHELLEHVESGSGRSALCSTRRSAGLPFMVQALVSSEPNIKGASCFKLAMQCLLQMALNSTSTDETKIHAFNILRALYRDTRLGDDVIPFIADGLQAAIIGFKGMTWGVRNSATLLFSTLVTRIFGVMRGKDELSKKNCMTGSVFFHRSPSLYKFFTDELKEATSSIVDDTKIWSTSSQQQPSLYPMLMILARLYPSSIEGTQSSLKLSVFIPYVMKCGRSPILNTRILAAKALVPLVSFMDVTTILGELFDSLPSSSAGLAQLKQNSLHGTLLQIYHLLMKNVNVSCETFAKGMSLNALSDVLHEKLWICSRENPCPVTRACFLDILDACLDLKIWNPCSGIIGEKVLKIIDVDLSDSDTLSKGLPGAAGLQMTGAKMSVRLSALRSNEGINGSDETMKRIIQLLCHAEYEVRLTTLRFLGSVLTTRNFHGSRSVKGFEDISDLLLPEPSVPFCEWNFVRKLDGDWIARVADSEELATVLITMATVTEQHPDCIIQLHHLMPLIPKTLEISWTCVASRATPMTSSSEKLEVILQKGECELSDDIRSALLHFTGFLIPEVYNEISHTKSTRQQSCTADGNNGGTIPTLVMMEWIEAFSLCCSPDQSFRVRLTATSLLVRNGHILLLDPQKCLGYACLTVWSAAVRLLQDDDAIIKPLASNLVEICSLQIMSSNVIHPALAIDILIGQFVNHFGEHAQSECLTTLLDWMLRQDVQETRYQPFEDEQKMFDKGQLNIFAEQINLTVLLRKHFKNLLHKIFQVKAAAKRRQSGRESPSEVTDFHSQRSPLPQSVTLDSVTLHTMSDTFKDIMGSFEMSTSPQQQQQHLTDDVEDGYGNGGNLLLQNVIDMIVEELALAMNDVEPLTDRTPFMSRSFDVIIVRLYRLVATVCCLCKYDNEQTMTLRMILEDMEAKFGSIRFRNQVVQSFVTDMRQLCLFHENI